jgi:hypothetical protein
MLQRTGIKWLHNNSFCLEINTKLPLVESGSRNLQANPEERTHINLQLKVLRLPLKSSKQTFQQFSPLNK